MVVVVVVGRRKWRKRKHDAMKNDAKIMDFMGRLIVVMWGSFVFESVWDFVVHG